MLSEMSASDIEIWRAWFDLEPRGDDRADWHAALIASQITAGPLQEPQSLDDMLRLLRACWDRAAMEKEKKRRKHRKQKRIAKQWARPLIQ